MTKQPISAEARAKRNARPQKVHKDFVTSNETLIAKRVIHPLDRNAIKEWIDGCPDREKGKEVLENLASMKRGEGWVWSPEIGFGPKHIAFPLFETFDSFAAPKTEADRHPKGWADVDLDEVRERLAASIEQAKQDDPKLLRAQIAELKRDLAAVKKQQPQQETKIERVEVPVFTDSQIKRLEEALINMHAEAERHGKAMSLLWDDQLEQAQALLGAVRAVAGTPSKVIPIKTAKPQLDDKSIKANRMLDVIATTTAKPPQNIQKIIHQTEPIRARASSRGNGAAPGFGGTLPIGERRSLTAIAQHPNGVTRTQLTVLTGYKRSTRDAYISRLREKGLIGKQGDRIVALNESIAALGSEFQPLPTGGPLREYWLTHLPDGERKVLQIMVDQYPAAVSRETISDATGYARSSRDAYIQRLSAKELVDTSGRAEVRASENLFA